MFATRCGSWYHLPDALTGPMEPRLFLKGINAPIGRSCQKHPGWWHYRLPQGWRLDAENNNCIFFDRMDRERAYLIFNEEPAELEPLCYLTLCVRLGRHEEKDEKGLTIRTHPFLYARLETYRKVPVGMTWYRLLTSQDVDQHATQLAATILPHCRRAYPHFEDVFWGWDDPDIIPE